MNFLVTVIAAAIMLAGGPKEPGELNFSPGKRLGTVESDMIREISGVAASRKNPGVLWVHNDSGDLPRLYAMTTGGRLIGIYTVTGAEARDWEDIAIGPGPDPNQHYIYIGDIGDNNNRHKSISIYRVPEPEVKLTDKTINAQTGPADRIRLTYPQGPRDAETLIVDPLTRDVYIITKRDDPSRVYRAAYPQSTDKKITLQRVADLPQQGAVAGDISPAGDLIVIKGYYWIALWKRPKEGDLPNAFSESAIHVPVLWEPQGEAVCFDHSGAGYFTISEKRNQPIYYFKRLNSAPK